jgi:predicted MFS family arabinose efflux permease
MDLVPRDSAARALSFFQTAFWVGSIVGMAAAGLAFEHLGLVAPILGSSLFAGAGIILLLLIRTRPSVSTA